MRLQVAFRVAGETKQSFTYTQLVEDLAEHGAGGGCIVQVGFLDYKMLPVAIDVPAAHLELSDRKMHSELASAELWDRLGEGLGINPLRMSGRLAVIVEVDSPAAEPPEAVMERLRQRGYRVELLDAVA